MALIETQDLWKTYQMGSEEIHALRGVSLKIERGEYVAIMGPSGSGKSTLFQLLSGLFVPDSGRIEVMGNDMRRDPVPALAKLGIVFQQPTLDLDRAPRRPLRASFPPARDGTVIRLSLL